MRVLLDTHALLWAALSPGKLPVKTRALLESFNTEVLVSAASAWEIATKVRIGKLPGAAGFSAEISARIEQLGFHPLAVTLEHASRAGLLAIPHRDPFDRMLIAQAQAENLPLVSNERLFDSFGIRRIWVGPS
ncbi:MAG TPA: type II toxin-antitoxin system VapC family toxin [Acidobacteriaceae bacterium]|jgi:PIN domain nuclease of toxin-antitoxin system|nr:type II toxin-antitoxin system VapC family toxin [Acidobacteriaceae bacterium]